MPCNEYVDKISSCKEASNEQDNWKQKDLLEDVQLSLFKAYFFEFIVGAIGPEYLEEEE